MTRSIRIRLSIMMFLQFFVFGTTIPIMSLYLRDSLNFTGAQTGIVLAMSAVAAFVSPLVGAFIADRVITAESLLAASHFTGAVLMAVLSLQTRFEYVLVVYLAYALMLGHTSALVNAVAFHHTPKANRNFGGIRMWGTVGWIAVAWLFSYLWLRGAPGGHVSSRLGDALKLSAGASLVFSLYALTLPKSHAKPRTLRTIIPIESFGVIKHPRIILLLILSFMMSFVHRYYYFGMAPFLRQIGFKDTNIMPLMSLGHVTEVFAMALLGLLLMRFGFKRVLIIGVLTELWRFTAFAIGDSVPLLISGNLCHGLSFTFYTTAAIIYLDSFCEKENRTGVHQLFAMINFGFANFFGNLIAGRTADLFTSQDGAINFRAFWTVPAVITALCLVAVVMFFDPSGAEKPLGNIEKS